MFSKVINVPIEVRIDGKLVERMQHVEITIDEYAIARELGSRAYKSKGKKARYLKGKIIVVSLD